MSADMGQGDQQPANQWRREAGRKGGQTTRDRHGTEHFRRAGKVGGSKGGSTTRDRYGWAYFEELGRRSGAARRAKRATTTNDNRGER
jgi:general stress protein YciG